MTFSSVRESPVEYEPIPLDVFFPLSAKDRPVYPAPPVSSLEIQEHWYRKPLRTNAREILDALTEDRSLRELAEITGWPYTQVTTVVSRMKQAGMVQRVRWQDRQAIYGRREP